MRVTIDPEAGSIVVSATAFLFPLEAARVITFFLNRDLEIDGLDVDGIPVTFTLDNGLDRALFAPSGRRVSVAAPVEIEEGVRLAVRYHGRITGGGRSVSRISTGLTELNLYAAWFPLFEGPQGFDYEIDLTAPAGQTVVGNGVVADSSVAGEGHTLIRGRSAAGDLPLILSPSMRALPTSESKPCDLEIFAVDLPDGVASWIASETASACRVLATWPGGPSRKGTSGEAAAPRVAGAPLRMVIVPREGDGYARPPLVVIPAGWFTEGGLDGPSTPEARDEILRRVFHEMAHVFAPLADTHTYDDWMNEGLAEYLGREALAAAGRGEAVSRFVRRDLLELAGRSPTPPIGATNPTPPGPGEITILLAPISATRRTDPDAHLLYYVKGAMIFRMLAGTIGRDSMAEALGELGREYPASSDRRLTTADLIRTLEREAGTPFDWLRQDWIDASGLPEISSDVRVERIDSTQWRLTIGAGDDDLLRSGGRPSLVTGSIAQSGHRPFRLLLPVVARRGDERAETQVRLSSKAARLEWRVPFEPSKILIDPDLTVPRVDPTVREALRLQEFTSRAAALTRDGLEAEKAGSFQTAIDRYDAASAADGAAVLPRYRRARVYAALGRYDKALEAHEMTRRSGASRARELERLIASVPPGSGAGEAPPPLWLPGEPDLRSWNEVRIGQIHDLLGARRRARRAYRNALDLPDLQGAHEEARRFLASPYRGPGSSSATPP